MAIRVSHRKLCLVTVGACIAAWVALTALAGCSQGDSAVSNVPIQQQVALGAEAYMTSCASCHGMKQQGVPRMGTALKGTWFVERQPADDLATFIKRGRAADGVGNQTGQPMPPRGGNPNLSDEQVEFIVAFLRYG
ncbi:MAG: cytochrome c [Planctomycetota bacterium]